jgi:hypothetical protein
MIFYYIRVDAFVGDYHVSKENDGWGFPTGSHLLWFEYVPPLSKFIVTMSDGFFVTDSLKQAVEKESFPELTFIKVDRLLWPEHNDKRFIDRGFKDTIFWKVEIPSDGAVRDFLHYQGRFLVVSQRALELLEQHGGFKDSIEGCPFGKEYEVLANRFWIPGDIKTYFEDIYPKESAFVEKMRKRMINEHHRREGRPPLYEGVD